MKIKPILYAGLLSLLSATATAADVQFSITYPADASLQLGTKKAHFVDFVNVEPKDVSEADGIKTATYVLNSGQVYNYRTSREGELTLAGYFTPNANAASNPTIAFDVADYRQASPSLVNHDVTANKGYETGDIFLNVNEKGFLKMKSGDMFRSHAMRSWELTDNVVNNYFIEPDFHYAVIGLDGSPAENILQISQAPGSAWAEVQAIGKGTAIVLVTYDAIALNYYSGTKKNDFLGGSVWGAIWPENTGVYIVTVDEDDAAINPEFIVNEDYNQETKKLAGKYVDAEHDVFYYVEGTAGYSLTFSTGGAKSVELAYPLIGERSATYTGFSTDGVTVNGDGTATVMLKEGRQIVRMTDYAGNATYQVLTAKKCTMTVANASRPDSRIFQPGDKVEVQFSGLRHPANKLAGIYNMSAYVCYNGGPNGSSLIGSSNQYTFGSASAAQLVKATIPDDIDVEQQPVFSLTEGCLQVSGFGDPIGNHRNTSYTDGRSPNFNAIAHQTYFGALPDVKINLTAKHLFDISFENIGLESSVTLVADGKEMAREADGHFSVTYGNYTATIAKPGYRCFRTTFSLEEGDTEQTKVIPTELVAYEGGWDGKEMKQPEKNEADRYVITTPAELAWFAQQVNGGDQTPKAVIASDIDLGDFDWTPIGSGSSCRFAGSVEGYGHRIDGLYVDTADDYAGLFGYVRGTSSDYAKVTGLTVSGTVKGSKYVGGLVAYAYRYVEVDTCANYADVVSSATATSSGAGGLIGYVNNKNCTIANSYNQGSVTSAYHAGGIAGYVPSTIDGLNNLYSVGEISPTDYAGACFGNATVNLKGNNVFAVDDYKNVNGYQSVSDDEMRSGSIAYRLGDAFGQKLGEHAYPVFGSPKVLFDADGNRYYNEGDDNDDQTTVVGDIESESTLRPEIYYNLQGVASKTPWKGINIVRMSDGTIKKVLFRNHD